MCFYFFAIMKDCKLSYFLTPKVIEQWGISTDPLWHQTLTRDIRLYENLQGSAVTFTPVADRERLAVKLSLSVLMT